MLHYYMCNDTVLQVSQCDNMRTYSGWASGRQRRWQQKCKIVPAWSD